MPKQRTFQGDAATSQRGKLRILVVEDEPSLLNTILFTLRRRGHDVEGADKGLGALERLRESVRGGEPFDLMVMDIQIPQMDGLQLLEAAKREAIPTPALVITGHGSRALKERMEQLGIVGWLDKPFSQDELCRQVRDAAVAGNANPNGTTPCKEEGTP